MNYDLMVLIGSLMNVFVLDRQIRIFFDKRRTAFPVFALSFLFYVVLINVSSMLALPRGGLPIWFATYIVLSLNFESTWKKRILAAGVLLAMASLLDVGVLLMFGVYFDHFLAGYAEHNFLTLTVVTLVCFMVALALGRLRNLKKDVALAPAVMASVFLIPLSSITLILIFAVNADPSPLAAGIASGIVFGTNVLVFWLLDRLSAAGEAKLQAALSEREKEYYLAQLLQSQESEERARSVRHDIKNHWAALKGLAAKIDADEITDYLDTLFDGASDPETRCDTGNAAIDSVVNYKLKNAERDGIRLDLDLRVPRDLNVEAPDLAAILGNLLDNALEAVARVEDKRISLRIEYARKNLLIRIENTFDGEVVQARGRGAREKRLLSRKPGDGHGLGLRNVRRALEKYDGHLEVAHEGGVFSARVLLYVKALGDVS